MGVRELSEAIILQSLEDLWNKDERLNSLAFIRHGGLGICTELLELSVSDKGRFFMQIDRIVQGKSITETGVQAKIP
jgi:hypothetical protein